jgi:hypothetical protein
LPCEPILKAGAVAIAKEMLPYVKPKVGAVAPDAAPLPADLVSDPDPQPDEPGPENPIL